MDYFRKGAKQKFEEVTNQTLIPNPRRFEWYQMAVQKLEEIKNLEQIKSKKTTKQPQDLQNLDKAFKEIT